MKSLKEKNKISYFSKKKNSIFNKLCIFFLLMMILNFHVFSQEKGNQKTESNTVIRITNAKYTSYKKDPETGNDIIELEGNVELEVEKESNVSKIKANKITYDRKTEMLFAQGNVTIITKSSSSGEETTTSSSLLFNTSTLEGVFEDGRVVQTQSDAINLPSGSTLVVFSDLFGKTESNTIAFKNSRLTFCDDENPHWYIDASRTWLLPGGEFAFFNAFLFVGPVPVIYFPAFYYPKDELIFNPVFGIDNRLGFYIQTTSYLLGRKPLENNTSSYSDSTTSDESLKALYNFMRPSTLKKQERQGLILHNLDENYEGDTSNFLKLKADWYSNLGGMIGLEGNFKPSSKYLTELNFSTDLGFSRTIFPQNNSYSHLSYKGNSYWDKSNFLGLKLPFRYGGNLNLTLAKPIKLSLDLPFYSDPFFYYDYKKRSETMDWISFFLNNKGDDDTETVSSYLWKLNSTYSPTLPDFLKPYISSLSVTLNSSINISSISNKSLKLDKRALNNDSWVSYSPERYFYFPSQVTPAAVSISMNGTLYKYPNKTKSSKIPKYSVSLNIPDELKTESQLQAEKEKAENEKTENEKAEIAQESSQNNEFESQNENSDSIENEKDEEKFFGLILPDLKTNLISNHSDSDFSYNLTYQIKSTLSTQFAYDSSVLTGPQDFNWKKVKSFMYTVKLPVSLSSDLKYGDSFIHMTNKLSYDPIWQDHPNTDGYDDKKSLKLADLKSEKQEIVSSNKILFKPFVYLSAIKDTGITYNTSMKIFRREFIGDSISDPEYEYHWVDFEDSDSVTTHNLDFALSTNQVNSKFKQTFTYSTTLKPQIPKHSFSLNLVFPYITSTFGYSFQETSSTDKTIKHNPFQQSLSISLFDSALKITESYNLNINEWNTRKKGNHSDSLKLSASWKSISLSYIMSYTYGYDFDNGWKIRNEKEFLPYSLAFTFSPQNKTFKRLSNKLSASAGFSTSVNVDFIRPTNSSFVFSPSLTFKITDFVSISFSSTSKNSILYWYFNKGLYDEGLFGIDYFPFNMFRDLINSFRFDRRQLRESAGFKIKNLSMSIDHELHDWKFSMSIKVEPRIKGRSISYDPYFTVGISWNPMESIKTQIVDEYGEWHFE